MTALGVVLLLALGVGTFGVALAGISLWLMRRGAAAPATMTEVAPVRLPVPAPEPARRVVPDPGLVEPQTDELTSPDNPLPGPAIGHASGGVGRFMKNDDSDESTEVFDQAKMSHDFAHLFVHEEETTTSGVRKPAKPPNPARPPLKG